MTLRLYNTLTRTKEDFVPLDPTNVRMYVCGPTVYDYAHIGNARPVIVFDVLFRLLRHLYGEAHVTYVRNITDVDDKINARALELQAGRNVPLLDIVRELTADTAKIYDEDMAALGNLPPTHAPRATMHIPQMIAMIEVLIAEGHAYPAQGHVLFDVSSKADYGKLARRSVDDMIAGARVDPAPYKRNPMDFVLWKPSDEKTPGWQSRWGFGRPGWHLECSAMSAKYLGETFDIHGGGIDLVFPHHENEIAQSECAHRGAPIARYWLHNGHLNVEGAKMSKSLGNFVTINELLTNWHDYGWPGEALRFCMLRTHYRQPIDWTRESLDESHRILWDWYGQFTDDLLRTNVPESIVEALEDDLNLPDVIAQLHALTRPEDRLAALKFLGFSGRRENIHRNRVTQASATRVSQLAALVVYKPNQIPLDSEIQEQIAARAAAKMAKNFAEADRIRGELDAKGIVLKDNKDGTTTWEVKR